MMSASVLARFSRDGGKGSMSRSAAYQMPRTAGLRAGCSPEHKDGTTVEFNVAARRHIMLALAGGHRGVHNHVPRVAERWRRCPERQRLVMRVEEQEEAIVTHRPAVVVQFEQCVAVEEDGERLRVAGLPVFL